MGLTNISIITICYNSELTIEKTIQSVLNQNYTNLEYIIVDGMSTDHTMEIVEKYKCDCMKVISEPDNGISDAFNKGISMASGTLIGLINSDDTLADGALEVIHKVYCETHADVIYGDTIVIDAKNNLQMIKKAKPLERIKYESPFIHQSCFISKEAYIRCGGRYAEEYKICMDYDMLAWLYYGKCKFVYTGSVISVFTYGGTSCRHPLRTINEDMRIARKYGLSWLEVFEYKLKSYIINIAKLVLSEIGVWAFVYRIINKKKVYVPNSDGMEPKFHHFAQKMVFKDLKKKVRNKSGLN